MTTLVVGVYISRTVSSDRLLCRSVGPYRMLDPQKGDCAYPHLSLSAVCLDFNLLLPSGNLAFSVSSLPLPFTWAKAWSPLSILLSFSAKTLTSLADSQLHDTFDSSRSLLLNFHRLLLDCRHLSPTDPTYYRRGLVPIPNIPSTTTTTTTPCALHYGRSARPAQPSCPRPWLSMSISQIPVRHPTASPAYKRTQLTFLSLFLSGQHRQH